MLEKLPRDIYTTIFPLLDRQSLCNFSITSKKCYQIRIETATQHEFKLFADLIELIQIKLGQLNMPQIVALNTLKEQIGQKKADNMPNLRTLRESVDISKIDLRKVLIDLKQVTLEQMAPLFDSMQSSSFSSNRTKQSVSPSIIVLPLGFKFFYLRLICDKKMTTISEKRYEQDKDRDWDIDSLLRECCSAGDLAKAKALAAKMINKQASIAPLDNLRAKVEPDLLLNDLLQQLNEIEWVNFQWPETQSRSLFANSDGVFSKKIQAFLKIFVENNHVTVLEAFYNKLNLNYVAEKVLESVKDRYIQHIHLKIFEQLAQCYIKAQNFAKATALIDRFIEKNKYLYQVDLYQLKQQKIKVISDQTKNYQHSFGGFNYLFSSDSHVEKNKPTAENIKQKYSFVIDLYQNCNTVLVATIDRLLTEKKYDEVINNTQKLKFLPEVISQGAAVNLFCQIIKSALDFPDNHLPFFKTLLSQIEAGYRKPDAQADLVLFCLKTGKLSEALAMANDIKKDSEAYSLKKDSEAYSLAWSYFVYFFIDQKNQQQASAYLDKVTNSQIRKKLIAAMDVAFSDDGLI